MNNLTRIAFIFATIVVGIIIGIMFYFKVWQPQVLAKMCLVNGTMCTNIKYWKYENTILFNMQPQGYWVWFNGEYAFLYDTSNSFPCETIDGEEYQLAYKLPTYQIYSSIQLQRLCIISLERVLKLYKTTYNAPEQKLVQYLRPQLSQLWPVQGTYVTGEELYPVNIDVQAGKSGSATLTVYEILTIFANKQIIKL